MAQFEVGGRKYQSRKLNAFQQFHLARKLAPAAAPFVEAVQPLIGVYLASQGAAEGGLPALGQMLSSVEPFLKVLANLPADDCDFVLTECLKVTSRADDKGGGWSPVWNDGAKAMMFDDIDMAAMLSIAGHVIKDNLAGFTSALSQISSGGAGKA